MNMQSLEDAVNQGLEELEDLRRTSNRRALTRERVMAGRERSFSYLRSGQRETLLALGDSMLGAIFAALGPDHFDLTQRGRSLLIALDDESLAGITPAGLCDGFLTVGELVRAMMALDGMDQKFLIEAMVIGMMLIKQDHVRAYFKNKKE